MKYTAILAAIFGALTVVMAGEPNHTPPKSNGASEPKAPASISVENNDITNTYAKHSDADPPKWYAAIERPDWWLVAIAFLTGLAIAYQAKEMRRATDAMLASTEVQEASLRQWVDVSGWNIYSPNPPHFVKHLDQLIKKPDKIEISILFDVINNTARPLTVLNVNSKVLIDSGRSKSIPMNERSIVSPNGGRLTTIVPFVLEGAEVDLYLVQSVVVSIFVEIMFEDSMRKVNKQGFKQSIDCNIEGSLPFDHKTKIATAAGKKSEEKAN